MANELVYSINNTKNEFAEFKNISSYGSVWVGASTGQEVKGAVRFTNIAIGQGVSVNYASLQLYIEYRNGNKTIKIKTYGIDEDNTADFSNYPMARQHTSAVGTSEVSSTSTGWYHNMDVSSQINEILGRSGWRSGYAMGFFIEDNGTVKDQGDQDMGEESFYYSKLVIRVNAEPNFKPTPQTISAPTFPDSESVGIRIAKSGINVLTATEAQLLFTTRKKLFKVTKEGQITTSGYTADVAHELSYKPAFLAFAKRTTAVNMIKLPRFVHYSDPVSGGISGTVKVDDTNLNISLTGTNTDIYYYIFIDEIG